MSEQQTPKKQSCESISVRQPSVMLSDLTGDLLWPRVLRAPALALSPGRLFIGAVCAFLLSVVLTLAQALFGNGRGEAEAGAGGGLGAEMTAVGDRLSMSVAAIYEAFGSGDLFGVAQGVWYVSMSIRTTVMESPVVSLVVGLPMIAILVIAGGGIARSTAIEFSRGRFASSDETIWYSLRRVRQFVGAVVGPIVLCVLIFLLISVGGFLLSFPVFDVIGSVLYGVGLVLGIFATVVLMLHVLALPMIVPALAVEGTDAFDAIQRSYAYLIGKPLRYLMHALILTLVGVLAAGVFGLVGQASIEMTDSAASFFAVESATRVLSGEGELGATKVPAHAIIQIWKTLVELAIAGYVISLFFTSSTLLYLVIRRICDGQDVNEIWDGVGE